MLSCKHYFPVDMLACFWHSRGMANKLPTEKKVAVISMLAEGSSIRAIERITGVNRNTIMTLAVRVGDACKRIMDEKMQNLLCKQIQVDEIWGFIGAKQKNASKAGAFGDVWTFIAPTLSAKRLRILKLRLR
jgi:hypothetical protein